jgi:hypothetical protein
MQVADAIALRTARLRARISDVAVGKLDEPTRLEDARLSARSISR